MGLGALGVLLQDEQLLLRQRWQCQVSQRAPPAQGPTSTRAGPSLSRQLMLLQGQAAIISIHLGILEPTRSAGFDSGLVFAPQQVSDNSYSLGCRATAVWDTDAPWLVTDPSGIT